MTKVLFPSFPRCPHCVLLTTSGGTLRAVPTTLWGIFETNTPHMELKKRVECDRRRSRNEYYPLVSAVFVVATDHLRVADRKPGELRSVALNTHRSV